MDEIKKVSYKKIKFPVLEVLFIIFCTALVPVLLFLFKVSVSIYVAVCCADAALFVFLFVFLIYRPMKKLTGYLSSVAEGDFGDRIDLGAAALDLHILSDNLNELVSIKCNDLMQNLKMEILQTQDMSNEFLTKVQNAVTNTSRISLGADYIRDRVTNLKTLADNSLSENTAVRSTIEEYRALVEQQAAEIKQTGEILDQMSSALKTSAAEMNRKKELSGKLEKMTSLVGTNAAATADNVTKISQGVDMLHDTIKVIASVANQTNLLAMNASIEAAHAGSAGAGFAVVAQEIRKLSEQTSKQVKGITASLKGMAKQIDDAVQSSRETGEAFAGIDEEVKEYISTFDSVIDTYSALVQQNSEIFSHYENIRSSETSVSSEAEKIAVSIEKSSGNLKGIDGCIREIHEIVDRNTQEALVLSRSQDPIYMNAVANGKRLEKMRRRIDVFRLSSVPEKLWKADKNELWTVIAAMFAHLDWTVKLLEYLHGKNDDVRTQIPCGKTEFDKWFYGDGVKKYGGRPEAAEIQKLDEQIHQKAILLSRLRDAGKEQEATIEFSELLELSRAMIIELNKLKVHLVKTLAGNSDEQAECKDASGVSGASRMNAAADRSACAVPGAEDKKNAAPDKPDAADDVSELESV